MLPYWLYILYSSRVCIVYCQVHDVPWLGPYRINITFLHEVTIWRFAINSTGTNIIRTILSKWVGILDNFIPMSNLWGSYETHVNWERLIWDQHALSSWIMLIVICGVLMCKLNEICVYKDHRLLETHIETMYFRTRKDINSLIVYSIAIWYDSQWDLQRIVHIELIPCVLCLSHR